MNTENDVITLVEETKPAKEKTKRTYEQQKERIKAYLKNRYANDEEFRNKINNKRLINSNLKYNTDEEYRLKKLEYMKKNRKSKKEVEQNNKDTLQDDIKKLEDMLTNTNNFNLKDVSTAKMLYDKIIKRNPDYKKMI